MPTPTVLLTPSIIATHTYCPRTVWFEHLLNMPQDLTDNFKVQQGRNIHTPQLNNKKSYLRQQLKAELVQEDAFLHTQGLRGRVDEVLEMPDGSLAPLDYRYAEFMPKEQQGHKKANSSGVVRPGSRVFKNIRLQMQCYAYMLQQQYNKPVKQAFVVFTRSQYHIETINVHAADLDRIKVATAEIEHLLRHPVFPGPPNTINHCTDCLYNPVCNYDV